MKLYRDIIRTAWETTWHNPVLWLCGLFLCSAVGQSIVYEWHQLRTVLPLQALLSAQAWQDTVWQPAMDRLAAAPASPTVITVAVVILVLAALVVIWMAGIAYTAVIDATRHTAQRPRTTYTLSQAWLAGRRRGLSVICLYILFRLKQLVILMAVLWPMTAPTAVSGIWQVLWPLLGLLLALPLIVFLHIWMRHSITAVVLDQGTFRASLRTGWQLSRAHFGWSLELLLLAVLIFVVAITLVPVVAAVLTLPLLALTLADNLNGSAYWAIRYDQAYQLVTVLGIFVVSILFSIWHISSWAALYNAAQQGKHRPVLLRLLRREVVVWKTKSIE